MISADIFDKTLRAALQNDKHGVIHYLDEAIEQAKSKNLKTDQVILSKLASSIGTVSRRGLGAQSATPVTMRSHNTSSLYEKFSPDVVLDEMVLNEEKKQTIVRMLHEWEKKSKLLEHGLFPNNRLLLYGPPGTGKTKLAKAIANYLDMDIVYVRLDELISSYLGKTGKNIREIFDLAASENVIIFLDEIDTIAKHRDDDQELGELKRVVTVLLQNIDLLSPNSLLIAATNHSKLLDAALWRRFPYRLEMGLPDKKDRQRLLKLFFGLFAKHLDIKTLVELTDGLSGSDIFEIVDKAKRQSLINEIDLGADYATSVFISEILKYKSDKKTRKRVYSIIAKMVDNGGNLYEISNNTGIPYSTLRDNVEGIKR